MVVVLACFMMPFFAKNAKAEEIASGTFGDNLTWTLNDEGVLSISGQGQMGGWYYPKVGYYDTPWKSYTELINTVIIGDEVTEIGNGAFHDCYNLTSISIGNGVTRIGKRAFYESGIQSLTIPDSVTSIEDFALGYCHNLETITVGEGVTSFGDSVFYDCIGIKEINYNAVCANDLTSSFTLFYSQGPYTSDISVTIGDNVERIPAHFFGGVYSNGIQFNIKNLTIGRNVKSIGEGAFRSWAALTNVTIPESVLSIGDYAFEDCFKLVQVTMPEGITTIGDATFRNCYCLSDITIPDRVTSIGEQAFYKCGITNLTIPDSVTVIGQSAFANCSITSLVIGQNVSEIGQSAFANCSLLTEVYYYPTNCDETRTNVFIDSGKDSTGIQLLIGDTVERIPAHLFSGVSSLVSIDFGSNVSIIGSGAFKECTGLTSLIIPENILKIEDNAFYGCNGLTYLNIGKNVESIGEKAFYNCKSLTELVYNAVNAYLEQYNQYGVFFGMGKSGPGVRVIIGDDVQGLSNYMFRSEKITYLYIGNNCTFEDGYQAFYGCQGITEICWNVIDSSGLSVSYGQIFNYASSSDNCKLTIGDDAQNVLWSIFNNSSLRFKELHIGAAFEGPLSLPSSIENITVSDANNLYSARDGILYNKSQKTIVLCPRSYSRTVNLPDTVKIIAKEAFYGCYYLEELTIPEKISTIEDSAFSYSNLQRLTFLGDLPSFGTGCFNYMTCKGYYPYGNTSWDERPYYSNVTWIPYSQGTPIEVSLQRMPDKVVYEKSEELDLSGLQFTVTYSDGMTWTYTAEEVQNAEFDFTQVGRREVTAFFEGLSFSFPVTVYENREQLIDSSEYPESEHPYANGVDFTYVYQYPGAFRLDLVFSEETLLENQVDYLYIMDSSDSVLGLYTGAQLSGETVVVSGDTAKIRLVTDDDWAEYGFSLTSIVAYYREGLCETGHNWNEPVFVWNDDNTVTASRTCKYDPDHIEDLQVTVSCEVLTPPSCEMEGLGVFTAAVLIDGITYFDTKERIIPAAGHSWGNVIFTWTGFTVATATRTCQKNTTHTETVDCVITSEVIEAPTATTEGVRIYTATAKFSDDTIVQSKKEEVIPALGWTWTRLAGANRYDTAALASKQAYADHSLKTIIVASGQSFPDALSGSALAGVYECPILLTNSAKLSNEAKEEIQRLAADDCTVLILGGTGTVSEAVENAIKKLGVKTERVAGSNREGTAAAVYEKGKTDGGFQEGGTVIIATGYSFADVLSISPYAYASKTPIILGKKDGSLSKDTKALLKKEGFTKAIIIGGTGSVSEASENYLKNTLGMTVLRLEGTNRYLTSGAIMKWELGMDPKAEIQPEAVMTAEGTGVATGANFPDALGSVSLLGKTHSPLLLAADNSKANKAATQGNIEELIVPNKGNMTKGFIFGGTGTVSKQIEEWLNDAVK